MPNVAGLKVNVTHLIMYIFMHSLNMFSNACKYSKYETCVIIAITFLSVSTFDIAIMKISVFGRCVPHSRSILGNL